MHTCAPTLTSHSSADSSPRSPCARGCIRRTYVRRRTERSSAVRRAGWPAAPAQDSGRVAEALGLGKRLELLEGVVLDLPDPLARHVERAADLLERVRACARQPEAHLDDLTLTLGEGVERPADVLFAEVLGRHLERGDRGVVLD